tara:strand:- start:581 stop:919 length:339 start_codon:yes stop_codon:yes gene_type:complete
MKAIIYYRKDHEWLGKTPFAPPSITRLDELDEVYRMDVNEHLGEYGLEEVWTTMQNVNGGDMPELLGVRSMMVGDIVVIGDKGWQVEATGWTPVSDDWLANEQFYMKPRVRA